jgi:hypothetical protein
LSIISIVRRLQDGATGLFEGKQRVAESRVDEVIPCSTPPTDHTNGTYMSNADNSQPPYKVGDIVNGHILTSQNVWVPVAEAPAAAPPTVIPAEKPKRLWYLRKRVIVPVAVVAAFIAIGAINGPADTDEVASTSTSAVDDAEEPAVEEAPVAEVAPAAEAEPEAAPAPEVGTASNPLPQPYVAKGFLGGEKYSLTGRVAFDAPDVSQWNMFNDPAPAGFKWVVIELTMTGIDEDGVEPSLASFDLSLSTPEGNQYSEDSGVVLDDGMPSMYESPTLYPGSAFTGYMSFLVPSESAGFMLYDNGNYVIL